MPVPRDLGRDFKGSSGAAARRRRETLDREDTMTEFSGERILLQELNHRTNNEFAAAISAVSLAARRSNNDEVKAVLSGVVKLLHQYAGLHRALQMPERNTLVDAATYLNQLCR